jgi:protein disulfide-isomerase
VERARVAATCAATWIDRSFGVKKFITAIRLPIFFLAIAIALVIAAHRNEAKTAAQKETPPTPLAPGPNSPIGTWATDYKRAQEEAKSSHKLLLLDFTGSDWCGFCIQLDKAILQQPQFKDYASKNLVLVEVDFPRRKAQSAETRKQNMELARRYQIEGFPTLVVLNGEGKTVWRYDGLYQGGIAAFLAELDKARKG